MKLIGTWLSPYVQRVMLAARHKGIELPMEAPQGGSRSAQHFAINPMGKIPVLIDGDLRLPESDVILAYLDDRVPEPTLYPGDAAQRAQARLLSRLLDTYGPASFGPFLQNDAAAIEVANQRIEDSLRYLDHFWRPALHAAGDEFSAADCALIPFFCIYERLQPGFGTMDRVARHERVAAWWSAARQREPARVALDALDAAVRALSG